METLIDDFIWCTLKLYPQMGSDVLRRLLARDVREDDLFWATERVMAEFAKKVFCEVVVGDGNYPPDSSSGEFCVLLHRWPALRIGDWAKLTHEEWSFCYDYDIPPMYYRCLQEYHHWMVNPPREEVELKMIDRLDSLTIFDFMGDDDPMEEIIFSTDPHGFDDEQTTMGTFGEEIMDPRGVANPLEELNFYIDFNGQVGLFGHVINAT